MSEEIAIINDMFKSQGDILTEEEKKYLELATGNSTTITALQCMSSLLLQRSLNSHAKALKNAAESSDKYAASLVKATWVLVLATFVLAMVSIIPPLIPFIRQWLSK